MSIPVLEGELAAMLVTEGDTGAAGLAYDTTALVL